MYTVGSVNFDSFKGLQRGIDYHYVITISLQILFLRKIKVNGHFEEEGEEDEYDEEDEEDEDAALVAVVGG